MDITEIYPKGVAPENIENFRQNKIKYILQDCKKAGIDSEIIAQILLARGFNKWIGNRKEFIKLKNELKIKITKTLKEMEGAKKDKRYYHLAKLKGRLVALNETRQSIRKICHSKRWIFPE